LSVLITSVKWKFCEIFYIDIPLVIYSKELQKLKARTVQINGLGTTNRSDNADQEAQSNNYRKQLRHQYAQSDK
jgi:hypothetical protein